jgi:hypothetical protein
MKTWYDNVPLPACGHCGVTMKPVFSQGYWRMPEHDVMDLDGTPNGPCAGVGGRVIDL